MIILLKEPEPAVVSILRLEMVYLKSYSNFASVAGKFLGMSRDHDTLKPIDYYQILPDLADSQLL